MQRGGGGGAFALLSASARSTRPGAASGHLVVVPLIILAAIGVGFVTVILKGVLLPFVVSLFLTYLIRPLVNAITTPFARCCGGGGVGGGGGGGGGGSGGGGGGGGDAAVGSARSGGGAWGGPAAGVGLGLGLGGGGGGARGRYSRVDRAPSPPKYPPRGLRGAAARACATAADCCCCGAGAGGGVAGAAAPAVGGGASSSAGGGGGGGGGSGSGSGSGGGAGAGGGGGSGDDDGCCGCGGGGSGGSGVRLTRCPRWFGIVVSMAVASALLAGLVLMVADAIQSFQQESLGVFVGEASRLVDAAQRWLAGLGIALEGRAILDAIKQQLTVTLLVQTTVAVLVDGVGNALLVLLLVLYLLSESSAHAPGSLRARIDEQVGRYVGIKTLISASQGALVWAIMGPWGLRVRMAHVFGVVHFLLNYIPTAGPVVATIIPLPVIVLDPALSLTAKVLAFVGPSVVHFVVGNFVEPLVFGSSLELHPVVVLLSLALWYALWGVPGAILAVPITAVLRIVLGAVERHTYAAIVISILEGRVSAALEGVDVALETSALAGAGVGGGAGGGGGGGAPGTPGGAGGGGAVGEGGYGGGDGDAGGKGGGGGGAGGAGASPGNASFLGLGLGGGVDDSGATAEGASP